MGRFRKISVSEPVYKLLEKIKVEKGFPSISSTIAYLVHVYEDVIRWLSSGGEEKVGKG